MLSQARMIEIGKKIAKQEYDVYLLEELWMKPDHATVKSFVPDGDFFYLLL
jgi:mannose-1-phosphate guanylyltransferase